MNKFFPDNDDDLFSETPTSTTNVDVKTDSDFISEGFDPYIDSSLSIANILLSRYALACLQSSRTFYLKKHSFPFLNAFSEIYKIDLNKEKNVKILLDLNLKICVELLSFLTTFSFYKILTTYTNDKEKYENINIGFILQSDNSDQTINPAAIFENDHIKNIFYINLRNISQLYYDNSKSIFHTAMKILPHTPDHIKEKFSPHMNSLSIIYDSIIDVRNFNNNPIDVNPAVKTSLENGFNFFNFQIDPVKTSLLLETTLVDSYHKNSFSNFVKFIHEIYFAEIANYLITKKVPARDNFDASDYINTDGASF